MRIPGADPNPRSVRVHPTHDLAAAEGASVRMGLFGHRVKVQPKPDSTADLETLRNRWSRHRFGYRRHPRQWLLRHEIPAGPRVSDERFSQIGSAVAAEIAAVGDLYPELFRRVGSAARLAERHRMVRTQREEQRSESDEQQHDSCIVVREAQACQAGRRNSSVDDCGFWWITSACGALPSSSSVDSTIPVCEGLSTAPAPPSARGRCVLRRSSRRSAPSRRAPQRPCRPGVRVRPPLGSSAASPCEGSYHRVMT